MQEKQWEKEYRDRKLVTLDDKPQSSVLKFLKFLKKEEKVRAENMCILDLGCGTGRNANYLALLGNEVTGLEISATAISLAKSRSEEKGLTVTYIKGSIGAPYPFADNHFDMVLDVTSGNSLTEAEREMYIKETHRVLKSGGYFFVRALCKDADENAKYLIKQFPGPEKDTYIMPELGITERVFTREDFTATYGKLFTILKLDKETHYTRMNNRSYKRNFWIAYLQK
ncbi:MAG TPA: class I SAM-dependent methyltransferase [Candidatus Paceibacterota bacterium]